MELGDITNILPGYAFRGAITPDKDGNIFVFQAKDLARNVPVTDVSNLTPISFNVPGYAGHLQLNDVLLIARGLKAGAFRSTVFKATTNNVIASASVHILRVVSPKVLPEYLSHFLNSKDGQDALSEIVSGSYIGALPRRKLETIKIPIPPMTKQKAIVDLYQNIRDQQTILNRRNELKQQIIEATFNNITKHHV
jgi:restriction endonuclease S subunit